MRRVLGFCVSLAFVVGLASRIRVGGVVLLLTLVPLVQGQAQGATLSGTIEYSGIHGPVSTARPVGILISDAPLVGEFWNATIATNGGPWSFELPQEGNYYLVYWLDVDADGEPEPGEPAEMYLDSPLRFDVEPDPLYAPQSGVALAFDDTWPLAGITGTVTYLGAHEIPPGRHVIVTAYVDADLTAGGYVSHTSNGGVFNVLAMGTQTYLRAHLDLNNNDEYESGEPFGTCSVSGEANIIVTFHESGSATCAAQTGGTPTSMPQSLVTVTATPPPTSSPRPSPTTPTPTARPGACTGDCSDEGQVTIDELLKGVTIALGIAPVEECLAFDENDDGQVTVDEIIKAVNSALEGCPSEEPLFPVPDPDPCDQVSEPCQSAIIGSAVAISTQKGLLPSTLVSDPNGQLFSLEWVPVDDYVNLVVTFPDLPPVDLFQLESGPVNLAAANITAAVLFNLNSSMVTQEMPTRSRALSSSASTVFNRAGCDVINNWPCIGSCSKTGKCCDLHDVCIHENCRGASNSGNVLDCAWRLGELLLCIRDNPLSPFMCLANIPHCSAPCLACHAMVTACYGFSGYPCVVGPGPSACCTKPESECGEPQECILNNVVITDPCLCVTPEVSKCPDQTFTTMNWHVRSTTSPDPGTPGALNPADSIAASADANRAHTVVMTSSSRQDCGDYQSGRADASVGLQFSVVGASGNATITIVYSSSAQVGLDGGGTAHAIVYSSRSNEQLHEARCSTLGIEPPITCSDGFAGPRSTSFSLYLDAGETYEVGLTSYAHADTCLGVASAVNDVTIESITIAGVLVKPT